MPGFGEGTTRGTTRKAVSDTAAYVCSPMHSTMNASLRVLMIGIVAVLFAGTLADRPPSRK